MCRTLAFFQSVEHREKWLERYAPWMGDEDRAEIADLSAYWYSGKSLGQHLELYDEDRERLKAWMIEAVDVTKEQRAAINRDKHRKVQERARRRDGAEPREKYLAEHAASRTEPWKTLGMGRTKYYDLGLHLTKDAGQVRDDLLYYRNEKSRTCPQAQRTLPSLPEGWPYCANQIVCRDGNARVRTSQDLSTRTQKPNYPNPATSEYKEAA
jgi:hypothetical protein